MSTTLTQQPDSEQPEPKYENQQTQSCCLSGGHARSSYSARFKSVLSTMGTHCKVSWNQSGFKSLKVIWANDCCSHKNWRACVCVSGFGSVSHRGKKTENIAQSHGREAPSLELIRETWIGERNGVGESISRKLWGEESSYARIRLHYKEVREWLSFHGGILFTSGVSVKTTGMFWNVFSGFATCVYSLAAATLLQPVITLFLSLCQQNYTPFNGVLLTSPDDCFFFFFFCDLHFSGLQTATIKSRDCQSSSFFLFLFPPRCWLWECKERKGEQGAWGGEIPSLQRKQLVWSGK